MLLWQEVNGLQSTADVAIFNFKVFKTANEVLFLFTNIELWRLSSFGLNGFFEKCRKVQFCDVHFLIIV